MLGSVFPALTLSRPGVGGDEEDDIISVPPLNNVRKVAVPMFSVTHGFRLNKWNLLSTLFLGNVKTTSLLTD